MSKKKILLVSPDPRDATAFYRSTGPFQQLEKSYPDIEIIDAEACGNRFDWSNLLKFDLAVFQRPFIDNHVLLIENIKTLGIPIWVEYDDHMLEVGSDNPTFQFYGNPKTKENVEKCLKMADIVTVTTQVLKDSYVQKTDGQVHVIPNALPDWMIERFPMNDLMKKPVREKIHVAWRGGHTHVADIDIIADDWVQFAQKYPDIHWHFFGYNPWKVTERISKESYTFYDFLPVLGYFWHLRQIWADIQLVPLRDTVFNRAKSNIAWLEGSWAGSAVISSSLPEFERPGTHCTNDLFGTLEQMLFQADKPILQYVNESREYIASNLMLSQTNQKRKEIIDQVA